MKLLFTLLVLASAFWAFAQETSLDNYTGDWGDNASWSGGWTDGSPAFLNLPESAGNITINGEINVGSSTTTQNLSFAANNDAYDFTVNDTLIVYGDVNFANKSMNLNLGNGAVFIILGNLDMNNKINVSSGGTLVVSGNFNKSGSQGSYTGTGNVYAGSFSGDAETTIDTGTGGDSSFTIDDLSTDGFTPIEEFVNGGGTNPLPVELVYFNTKIEKDIELAWATATEINNDYFAIERSEDGEFFYEIGSVPGNGNSSKLTHYTFTDKFAFAPVTYYRLKQVDFDGQYEYFDVQRVETGLAGEQNKIIAYPTVISSDAHLTLSSSHPFQIQQITFYSLSGGQMKNWTDQAVQENPLNYVMNLDGLDNGIYLFALITSDGIEYTSRIIIK